MVEVEGMRVVGARPDGGRRCCIDIGGGVDMELAGQHQEQRVSKILRKKEW